MPPTPSSGRNTIATTTIPTPPNHCSMPRHKSTPCDMSSSPTITVDPVVVMPDIASKYASTTRRLDSPRNSGSAPNIGATNQMPVVSRNICCKVSRSPAPLAQDRASTTPNPNEIAALSTNADQLPLPICTSSAAGSSIVRPNTASKSPMT